MKSTLLKILTLQPVNLDGHILLAAAFLWLVVVGVGISSVLSQPVTRFEKIVWSAVIVLIPLFGLLVYGFYSLRFIDFRFVTMFGPTGKLERKVPGPVKENRATLTPAPAKSSSSRND